ncbi:MAG: protein translocase subunit SecD, partial [Acidobacteriaceae bacterium]
MQKNLRAKTLAIIAILVVFVYGIFGLPHGVSGTALKAALLKNINLGLDLKGGTHLVLQVMVDEAVGAATDSDAGAIQTDLQQNGIQGATVTKPDANKPDMIQISGVPADKSGDVSSVLNGRYGARYDITPGVNTWTLVMKNTVE